MLLSAGTAQKNHLAPTAKQPLLGEHIIHALRRTLFGTGATEFDLQTLVKE
jgi:hypothetical protein